MLVNEHTASGGFCSMNQSNRQQDCSNQGLWIAGAGRFADKYPQQPHLSP